MASRSLIKLVWIPVQSYYAVIVGQHSIGPSSLAFVALELVDKEYTVHSPKELNTRCDDLSRRISWEEMHIKRLERRTVPLLQAETDELIVVCDPKRRFCSDDDLAYEWGRIFALL